MIPIATSAEIRAAEAPLLSAGEPLMQRAADAVAAKARELAKGGRILAVLGPGNNGGDGWFAAAKLAPDHEVWCWPVTAKAHPEARQAALAAGAREVDALAAWNALTDTALVIDAVLGISGRAGLDGPVAVFAAACADLGVPVLSVDLPSGLAADAGEVAPSFVATATVTFGALKPCHALAPARQRCGEIKCRRLGIEVDQPQTWQAEAADVVRHWPVPKPMSDKYSRGVVGLDVGSATYPGAALLSCAGALYTGVGMVRYLGDAPAELVLGSFPSVVLADGQVQALVIGSGWAERLDAQARLAVAAARNIPLIVDADALRLLPAVLPANSLLTPHVGELARLLELSREEVTAEPIAAARQAAAQYEATVLLKGPTQVVATPSGRATVCIPGPAWTAQAGSGDTLAGSCGALLAAGLTAETAAVLAASAQALTARRQPGPYPPDQLARFLPAMLAELVAN